MPDVPAAMNRARFEDASLTRPTVRGCDVVANLEHFAIITYAIPPERLRPHVHPRFDLNCTTDNEGHQQALISMVPFEDQDFHFVGCPWAQFRFGQTNYRAYVIDRESGHRAVWFFGTTLDSWAVNIPRHLWKLPWHPGRIRFDCAFDEKENRYTRYSMTTSSDWAPVEVEVEDTGKPVAQLDGFEDLESGLFIVTHPLGGYFHRRDGQLGSYSVWHDRLRCTEGRLTHARVALFERLGLASYEEQQHPHSVLLQHRTEFTIYLPPRRL
jgi:hypothetical protein